MYNLNDVVYEDFEFWILDDPKKSCYEIFKKGCTCSTRVGNVSKSLGLNRAIKNINILHKRERPY